MSDDSTLDPESGEPAGGEVPPTPDPGREPDAPDAEEAHLRHLLRAGSAGADGDPFSAIFTVRARVNRKRVVRAGAGFCLLAGLVSGVGLTVLPGGSHSPRVAAGRPAAGRPGGYHLTGTLVSFDACSQYLDYVKSQAEAVVSPYGLETFGSTSYDVPGGAVFNGFGVAGGIAEGAPVATPGAALGAAGPAQGFDKAATPAVGSTGTNGTFSQTNDQVAGVDEPDTVKTDGQVVVTLVGSTLRVLGLDAHVIGSLQLPGDTGGGFLLDGSRAIVLSSTPTTNVGTAGYDPPYQQFGGVATGPASPSASPGSAEATVVDLSDPAHPQLVHSFLFDGQVVAARLVGGAVRLVLRSDGPSLNFVTPSSTGDENSAKVANRQLIAASTLSDWLPAWQVQSPDGSTTARQPLSTCGSIARPLTASGLSTVTVLSLDPAASAPGPGTSVVAAGQTVYATADQIYVAGASASGPSATTANAFAGAQQEGCCSLLPPVQASTLIYAFAVQTSGAPVFEGSGSVPGWLINSYAMDEDSNGLLRVATTSQTSGGDTQSQITVLERSGSQLSTVGTVGGLGHGEFIKAVRFNGDQAYVVTYRSFDPLYVVDLANPRAPKLVGTLDQPGFSEFLYPLPNGRLLGVGVQITDGEPSGLLVATYDVSDPAHPRQLASSVLASGFQYVDQGYDPHAFLFWPDANLALLAVPGDGPYGSSSGGSGIAAYQIGASGQLTRSATLSHGTDPATRSIVVDGQVWAVTTAGVVTANLTDLPASTWHSY